ncbi:MAG: transposase, partial [Bacteroidota bacterium]|nr:transposase [Bacteroidota bacterium]
MRTVLPILIGRQLAAFAYCIGGTDNMVFTDVTWKFFSLIQFRVRKAVAQSQSPVPFIYEDEPFFRSYSALYKVWVKRRSQRQVAESLNVSRKTLKHWERNFVDYGAL